MRSIVFILGVLVLGCSSKSEIYLEGKEYSVYTPPNTVKISENFYADETEVSNIDYKEYLYWLTRLYGYESTEYLEALPDTLVWRTEVRYGEPFKDNYFRHPAYDGFPLVGVNLNQAKKFTDWRTERVAQMILTRKKLIEPNDNSEVDNYFTINRYLEGDYDWIIKRELFAIPKYKIPNVQEWERIAGIDSNLKYGTDSLSRYNKKILKKYNCLFNTDDDTGHQAGKYLSRIRDTPNYVRSLSKNVYGLYGIIGNVAELVEDDVIKGGSWRDKIEDVEIVKNRPFEKPNCWVGFRNICKFEVMKKSKITNSN